LLPSIDFCRVYHGTNLFAAKMIQHYGIYLHVQRQLTDFGKGFYVTFNLNQAKSWATVKARNPQVYPKTLDWLQISKEHYLNHPYTRTPAYLAFDLNLNQLIFLKGKIFSFPHEWGWHEDRKSWERFIKNCRTGFMHNYDYVYGPVGGSHPIDPDQVKVSHRKDQLSLNSIRAIHCLSNLKIFTFHAITPRIEMITRKRRKPENILSHEIHDKVRVLGNFTSKQAEQITKKSWLYPYMWKTESPLFHEQPCYWAFSILYGPNSLWYEDYEEYLVEENR